MTIPHIVLEFQVDRAGFHWEEVSANLSGKWNRKEEKKKERKNSTATTDRNILHLDVRIYIINNTAKSNHLHIIYHRFQ